MRICHVDVFGQRNTPLMRMADKQAPLNGCK